MIAIDTNVLVRMLVLDDADQTARARQAVAQAETAGETILIDDIVLAETMWTVERRYKAPRSRLLELAKGLLDVESFAFERRDRVEDAVRLFEASSADFSDCLIFARTRAAGSRATLTFDAACRRLPLAQLI